MKQNSELRELAYNIVKEYWKPAVIATLVILILGYVYAGFYQLIMKGYGGAFSRLLEIAFSFGLLVPVSFAYSVAMLDFYRGEREGALQNVINYFRNDYKRCFSVGGLVAVYTCLWCLLLIVPGIIKSYSYAMTYYIAKDNPDLKAEEAIQASMKVMAGNKMKLFLLDLGFIGWFLLCCITFGIASLFVNPYVQLSHAAFYEDLMQGKTISTVDETVEEVEVEVVK